MKNEQSVESPLESLAKTAYTAYGDHANWKTFDGRNMPTWNALTDAVRQHWIAASHAIAVVIDPNYLLAQSEKSWITDFDSRQQAEINFSRLYYRDFQHGTDGHNAKVIIAKLCNILDANGAKAVGHESRS